MVRAEAPLRRPGPGPGGPAAAKAGVVRFVWEAATMTTARGWAARGRSGLPFVVPRVTWPGAWSGLLGGALESGATSGGSSRWAMMWTSMPDAPASWMTVRRIGPPSVICHQLRCIEPITIWVIWCSCAKPTRAWAGSSSFISCQRAPRSAASARSPSIGWRSAGGLVSPMMTWTTSSSALTLEAMRAARRSRTSVPGLAVTAAMMRSVVSHGRI